MQTLSPALYEQTLLCSGGTALSLETAGGSALPPVVWVPDTLTLQTKECWDYQFLASDLPNSYFLVRYDPRGHGHSSAPKSKRSYNLKTQAADLHTVLSHLNLQDAVLVGSGWGGAIITEYLRTYDYSSTVAGIAFVNAVTEHSPRWRYFVHSQTLQGWLYSIASSSCKDRPRLLQDFIQTIYWRQPDRFTLNQMIANALRTPQSVLSLLADQASQGDSRALLESLDIPVLAVQGENDPLIQSRAHNFIVSHTTSAETYSNLYRQVGHCPFHETSQFNRDLKSFLATIYDRRLLPNHSEQRRKHRLFAS